MGTLHQLALAQLTDSADQVRHDVVLTAVHTVSEGSREDIIAHQHRITRLPHSIYRGFAATQVRLVDHVVVDQRCGVQHLDDRGCEQGSVRGSRLGITREHTRRKQNEHRAHALAAIRDHVFENRAQGFGFGVEESTHKLLILYQILFNRAANCCNSIHYKRVFICKYTVFSG